MIGFPNELPCVLWHGGRPLPLNLEWITASVEITAYRASESQWAWSADVAHAMRLYFRQEFQYATITPSELVELMRQTLQALGKDEMARMAQLAPPRTSIYLPEIAHRAGMELAFFGLLREQLHEVLDAHVSLVRLQGVRQCAKLLDGAGRWRRSCSAISTQIELFAQACVQEKQALETEILLAP